MSLARIAALCCCLWCASILVSAQEAAAPTQGSASTQTPAPTPPAQPTQVVLPLDSICYITGISDAGETSLDAIGFRDQDLHPSFHTSRILTGHDLFDAQLRTDSLKIHWLPVSLYYVPLVVNGHYTYSPAPSTEGGTAAPATTVTYARYALYGVISANASHIFDFKSEPLKTENGRAGVGILWARKQSDRQAGQPSAGTKTNPLAVRMQGLELARSTEGGDTIWYLSFVRALQ